MGTFQWDSRYSVQIDFLDNDHRDLIKALNDLWTTASGDFAPNNVRRDFQNALAVMKSHFRREEEVMAIAHYPRRHKHEIEHRRLVARLESLQSGLDRENTPATLIVAIGHLQRHLGMHILKSDKHYSRHIINRNGSSASEGVSAFGRFSLNALERSRWLWQVLLIFVLGFTVSLGIYQIIRNSERQGTTARFHELADQHIVAIQSNIDLAIDSVGLIVGHFEVSGPTSTSRADFRRMVTPTLAKHRYIQGYSWDPRVLRTDLGSFEAAARREGPSEFRVFERDSEGNARPVDDRAEYFPVFYMEPATANTSAIGFDLASNSVRRKALDEARDGATPIVTARITLVQESGNQFGVLVLAPVYHREPAADITERQRLLTGYVSGVFRIGDLIEESGGKIDATRNSNVGQLVRIHMFDLPAPSESQLLYPNASTQTVTELTAGLHATVLFPVAGRTWQLVVTPSELFLKSHNSLTAPITLAFGLLLTALLAYSMKTKVERLEREALFTRQVVVAKQRQSEAHRIARLGFIEFDPAIGQWILGEGAEDLLGLEGGRTSGTVDDIFGHVDPGSREALEAFAAQRGGRPLDLECRIGDRTLQAVSQGVIADGRIGPIFVTLQDVTGRREAEEELTKMLERLGEANKFESLGTLAGGIAHEINTPAQYVGDNLRFLQTGIETLLGVAEDAKAVAGGGEPNVLAEKLAAADLEFLHAELPAAANQALEGVKRIGGIVRAIKEFSHPSSDLPAPFDLNHVIEAAATVTKNQWKYVANLDLDLDPALPPVTAIEGEINQILLNLIVNAAQAIAEKGGGAHGRIALATRLAGDMAELSVGDTGVGIPEDKHRKIFEMFYTTKPLGQGTGQGLAIVHSIIRRHGGTIEVESAPGQGALFRIRLPIAGRALEAAEAPSGEF